MPALFPRWSNTVFPLVVALVLLGVVALVVGPMLYARTPYNTKQFAAIPQPVEFDHRHHVRDDGIGCLYCHSSAETSANAGIPSTDVCMGCHNQIWSESPLLEPVRLSYFTGVPIPWKRVNRVPDFVFFNHSVHVRRGVDCVTCHGRVDRMPRVFRQSPLNMGWCLDCHNNPKQHLESQGHRLIDFDVTTVAFAKQLEPDLSEHKSLTRLTTCTACHR